MDAEAMPPEQYSQELYEKLLAHNKGNFERTVQQLYQTSKLMAQQGKTKHMEAMNELCKKLSAAGHNAGAGTSQGPSDEWHGATGGFGRETPPDLSQPQMLPDRGMVQDQQQQMLLLQRQRQRHQLEEQQKKMMALQSHGSSGQGARGPQPPSGQPHPGASGPVDQEGGQVPQMPHEMQSPGAGMMPSMSSAMVAAAAAAMKTSTQRGGALTPGQHELFGGAGLQRHAGSASAGSQEAIDPRLAKMTNEQRQQILLLRQKRLILQQQQQQRQGGGPPGSRPSTSEGPELGRGGPPMGFPGGAPDGQPHPGAPPPFMRGMAGGDGKLMDAQAVQQQQLQMLKQMQQQHEPHQVKEFQARMQNRLALQQHQQQQARLQRQYQLQQQEVLRQRMMAARGGGGRGFMGDRGPDGMVGMMGGQQHPAGMMRGGPEMFSARAAGYQQVGGGGMGAGGGGGGDLAGVFDDDLGDIFDRDEPQPAPPPPVALNAAQLSHLKGQIVVCRQFELLLTGQRTEVPSRFWLQMALAGNTEPCAQRYLRAPSPKPTEQQRRASLMPPVPPQYRDLRDARVTASQAAGTKAGARRRAASKLVMRGLSEAAGVEGADRTGGAEERERWSKVQQWRDKQLAGTKARAESLEGEAKSKALVAIKGLSLLQLQRKLREDLMAEFHEPGVVDFRALRRVRPAPQQVARSRMIMREREEREERERMVRERRRALCADAIFQRDVMTGMTNAASERNKIIRRGIKDFHKRREKEERQRQEREQQERLQALKANDMNAYMRLIRKAKNDRIQQLLRQTDTYLEELGSRLKLMRQQTDALEDAPVDPNAEEGGVGGGAGAEEGGEAVSITEALDGVVEEIREQPKMLKGGTLRAYQMQGLRWLVSLYNNGVNGILADEMGLGKTIQVISLLAHLMEVKNDNGPFLVVVPCAVQANWQAEFRRWLPEMAVVVYAGTAEKRLAIYHEQVVNARFNCLLTTYEYIMSRHDRPKLSKIQWRYVVIDEGHRIKNAGCKLNKDLGLYTAAHRLLLSGTPVQNNLDELWTLLNFLMPTIFDSSMDFQQWFNQPFESSTGAAEVPLDEEEHLLLCNRLHQVLRPFVLRRLKEKVESELPAKTEHLIPCQPSAYQRALTRRVEQKLGAVPGQQARAKSVPNSVMEMRNICNHPYLSRLHVDGAEASLPPHPLVATVRLCGKLEVLDRVLPKLKASGHKVLIFSTMTRLLDVLEDYLEWRGMEYLRLDGAVNGAERGPMIEKFNAKDSSIFCFLLSLRAGGQGINLQAADTVIIYDTDWNPQVDLQAQARAHRIGQKSQVLVLRLETVGTIEEKVRGAAEQKMGLADRSITGGFFDGMTSAEERRKYMETLIRETSADKAADDAEMDDEALNRIIARSDDELDLFEEMDQKRSGQEREIWEGTYRAQYDTAMEEGAERLRQLNQTKSSKGVHVSKSAKSAAEGGRPAGKGGGSTSAERGEGRDNGEPSGGGGVGGVEAEKLWALPGRLVTDLEVEYMLGEVEASAIAEGRVVLEKEQLGRGKRGHRGEGAFVDSNAALDAAIFGDDVPPDSDSDEPQPKKRKPARPPRGGRRRGADREGREREGRPGRAAMIRAMEEDEAEDEPDDVRAKRRRLRHAAEEGAGDDGGSEDEAAAGALEDEEEEGEEEGGKEEAEAKADEDGEGKNGKGDAGEKRPPDRKAPSSPGNTGVDDAGPTPMEEDEAAAEPAAAAKAKGRGKGRASPKGRRAAKDEESDEGGSDSGGDDDDDDEPLIALKGSKPTPLPKGHGQGAGRGRGPGRSRGRGRGRAPSAEASDGEASDDDEGGDDDPEGDEEDGEEAPSPTAGRLTRRNSRARPGLGSDGESPAGKTTRARRRSDGGGEDSPPAGGGRGRPHSRQSSRAEGPTPPTTRRGRGGSAEDVGAPAADKEEGAGGAPARGRPPRPVRGEAAPTSDKGKGKAATGGRAKRRR